MQHPTRQEKMDYVADMAEQLAMLCQNDEPLIAAMLMDAADAARAQKRARKR